MAEPGNSYRGVHSRLRAVRGDPAEHPCWNPACERPAREWGLFAPPTHREEVQGDTLAWSVNLSDYVPMCHPCNLRMGRGDWATCPRGHDRLTAGVRPNGQCRECHRIVNRNYMRRKRIELKGLIMSDAPADPNLLTLRDIARLADLAEGSVRAYHNQANRARREGKVQPTDLPAPDLVISRAPTWRRDTIDRWLEAREERRRVAALSGEKWAGSIA